MTSTDVRRVLWNGSLPIKVILDPGECRTFDQSDPYYVRRPLPLLPLRYYCQEPCVNHRHSK